MKRSQLDSREQMTYAEPERRIVREQHREVVQSKVKKKTKPLQIYINIFSQELLKLFNV